MHTAPLPPSLTRTLGLRHPIVQSGLERSLDAELAATVSAAGGLGALGTIGRLPEQLRAEIRRTRAFTDQPFAVNLVAWSWAPFLTEHIAVLCQERVPVVTLAFGDRLDLAARCAEAGCKVLVHAAGVARARMALAIAPTVLWVEALDQLGELLPAASAVPVIVTHGPRGPRLSDALAAGAAGLAVSGLTLATAARVLHDLVADLGAPAPVRVR